MQKCLKLWTQFSAASRFAVAAKHVFRSNPQPTTGLGASGRGQNCANDAHHLNPALGPSVRGRQRGGRLAPISRRSGRHAPAPRKRTGSNASCRTIRARSERGHLVPPRGLTSRSHHDVAQARALRRYAKKTSSSRVQFMLNPRPHTRSSKTAPPPHLELERARLQIGQEIFRDDLTHLEGRAEVWTGGCRGIPRRS